MKEKLYSQEEVNRLLIEARIDGIKFVLDTLYGQEGRIRQVANTVYEAALYIAELEGEEPEDFGDYREYLKALNHRKEKP